MRKAYGFTIVELLIVVVVIAILATITIAAFNGIQERSRQSAAQATAKQAYTKITAFSLQNSDTYPSDTSSAGLTNTTNTAYEYRVDNASNPRSFCLTVTTQNTSYYVSSAASSPQPGGCNGHGVNGIAAITNHSVNPSAESNGAYENSSMGTHGTTITRVTDRARSGDASFRITANGTSAGRKWSVPFTGGTEFRWSAYIFSANAITLTGYGESHVSGTYTPVFPQSSNSLAVPAGTWHRVSWTGTVPAGGAGTGAGFLMTGGNGQIVWVDDVMVTFGNTERVYADGSSPGWFWNGSPNASTSLGPPL